MGRVMKGGKEGLQEGIGRKCMAGHESGERGRASKCGTDGRASSEGGGAACGGGEAPSSGAGAYLGAVEAVLLVVADHRVLEDLAAQLDVASREEEERGEH